MKRIFTISCILSAFAMLLGLSGTAPVMANGTKCVHMETSLDVQLVPVYTQSKANVCYHLMELTTYCCNSCGSTWVSEQSIYSVTHDFTLIDFNVDGAYIYYIYGCKNAGCNVHYTQRNDYTGQTPWSLTAQNEQ